MEKQPYVLKILIPGCPCGLNRTLRMNGHKRNRVAKEWYSTVYYLTKDQRPKQPLKKFKVIIIRYAHRFLDYDGLVGSMKFIVDGLKHSKIIKDDSWSMTGRWDVSQEFRCEKDGQQTYLEIREEI